MNLAARFSTSANIGELDIRLTRQTLVFGNLALLQVQALLVSLLAGLIAFILGLLSRVSTPESTQEIGGYFECVTVLVASMLAAGLSSAVVGSFMCSLVVLSRKWRINPDNIATPLAASLGDLLSLVLLGLVSAVLVRMMGADLSTFLHDSLLIRNTGTFVSTIVFILLLVLVGVNVAISMRNAYVQELLTTGWLTLIVAMLISR